VISKESESDFSYRNVVYGGYSDNFGGVKTYDRTLQFREYSQVYSKLPNDKGAAILDVGCGKCEWLDWLSEKGYTLLGGVDRATSELAKGTGKDYRIHEGDATQVLSGFSEEFDLIHAKDLFEHFSKDEAVKFLLASFKALKPGGEIWIRTFNAQSPMAAATRYGDFSHEIGVTPGSLAQVLTACGFGSISVSGYMPTAGGWKGMIRKVVFSLVTLRARIELKVRHGGSSRREGVDVYNVMPDVFGIGRKT